MAKIKKKRSLAELFSYSVVGIILGVILGEVDGFIDLRLTLICGGVPRLNAFLVILLYLIEIVAIVILYIKQYIKFDGPFVLFVFTWLYVLFTVLTSTFTSCPLLGTSCIPTSGYYFCSDLNYAYRTGNLSVVVSQNTSQVWTSWAALYAPYTPQGTNLSTDNVPNLTFISQQGSLASGQTAQITLPATGSVHVGYPVAGGIWVCYTVTSGATVTPGIGNCTSNSGTITYEQIATLTARATG